MKVRKEFHTGKIAASKAVFETRKKELENQLKGYSKTARKDWGDSKTVETPFGNYGFRKNPPSVALIKKVCKTFDQARDLVRDQIPDYLRTVEEVDKEAILRDYEKEGLDLEGVGLKINNKEKFFVKTACEEKLEEAREKLKTS